MLLYDVLKMQSNIAERAKSTLFENFIFCPKIRL